MDNEPAPVGLTSLTRGLFAKGSNALVAFILEMRQKGSDALSTHAQWRRLSDAVLVIFVFSRSFFSAVGM